jgi:hypothetical protein
LREEIPNGARKYDILDDIPAQQTGTSDFEHYLFRLELRSKYALGRHLMTYWETQETPFLRRAWVVGFWEGRGEMKIQEKRDWHQLYFRCFGRGLERRSIAEPVQ